MPAAASLTFKVYKLCVSLTSTLTFLRGIRYHKESLHQLSAEKSLPSRSNSSPGHSPRSKWRSEKPLAKAAEILHESWSILSRDTWWNGFLEVDSSVWRPCLYSAIGTVIQTKRRHFIAFREEILTNFWSHFGSLGLRFLRSPFWTRRRPWGRGCRPGSFKLDHMHHNAMMLSTGICWKHGQGHNCLSWP